MSGFVPFAWEDVKTTPSGLRYTVKLQDYILRGESGADEATMFTYSYTLDGADSSRPVLFAYNGGPGSASTWLHMGLLGPKLAALPGFPDDGGSWELRSNGEFLLDRCDIVLVDPVGTGWARLLDKDAAGKYYSVAGDAHAFSMLIEEWLLQRRREDSPVYLLGESYGTIRNLVLADALPENINLRGIVHIGVSFNVGARGTMYIEPNVRRLGTNAAACRWRYHPELDEAEFVKEAMEFAYSDYLHALALGKRMDKAEREGVLDRLAYFTGMDRAFLDEHNLRFSEQDFMLGLVPGAMLSMYDSRLTHVFAPGEDGSKYDFKYDPFMERVANVYDLALERYISDELASPPGRALASDTSQIALNWDYASYAKDTLCLPEELMRERAELRMMFVSGRYDLSSTFDFVDWYLSQYDLDPARTERLVLPSGHAAYVGEGMAEVLSRRIRAFIR